MFDFALLKIKILDTHFHIVIIIIFVRLCILLKIKYTQQACRYIEVKQG